MTFTEFRRTVAEYADEIPPEFLRGLQAISALEDEYEEPGFEDVYRLGECLDIGPEQFLGSGGGIGRHVVLYWGSFRRIAAGDPDFDWEEEIWETLTHELRHHVESLAGDGSLIEQDEIDARQFPRRRTDSD